MYIFLFVIENITGVGGGLTWGKKSPDRLWGPPSLLLSGCQVLFLFSGGESLVPDAGNSPLSTADVMNE